MGDHNAAQSALFISEIFQHICERATKMDSYRLALTSQAFKEAALGRLWEEMDSLEPLLKLIPSLGMTCERDGVIHPRRNWTIPGPIPEDDWTTFDEYASRIRSFRYTHDTNVNFDVYHNLFIQRGRRPLLPLLHHLRLTHLSSPKPISANGMINELLPFLSPSLISLSYSYHGTEDRSSTVDPSAEGRELDAFFGMLPVLCPYLRTVVSLYPLPMISLRPFTQLRQLRRLSLQSVTGSLRPGVFNAESFRILALLEALQTLSISGVYGHCFDGVPPGGGFPSLHSLFILQCDSKGLSRFLELIPPTSLRNLGVSTTASLTVGEVLPALPRFTPSLKQLYWTVGASPAFQATLDDNLLLLEPLFSFRHLETLHIKHVAMVKRILFAASHIQKMSRAWPSLREFIADSVMLSFNLPSLVAFVQQFPTLRSVHLHLDLEGGITAVSSEILPRRNSIHTLVILSISPHTFDSEKLSHFIFDLFPCLTYPFVRDEELQRKVNQLIKCRG